MARLNEVPFVKGHGTGNDFVIIPDVDGRLDLTPDHVRWLCDRHLGIGGNGQGLYDQPRYATNHPQGHPRCPTTTLSDRLARECAAFASNV
mgnify:CR=1 FL=1